MSWNRPSSAPQPQPKKSVPPSLVRGLLAGLVVAALGALCLCPFLSGDDASAQGTKHKARGTIREVAPAAAPTNAVPTAEKPATNVPPQDRRTARLDARLTSRHEITRKHRFETA